MVDRERLKLGQGSDLCLALMTSFSGDENEMTRLRSMFGGDFSTIKLDLKVWVGLNEGWVDGGGSVRTRMRDGSVRMRDGSVEDEDKGWVGGVACMRRRGRVSRGGSGHHRRGWV